MPTRQTKPLLLRLCRAVAAALLIFLPKRRVAADAGTPEFVEPPRRLAMATAVELPRRRVTADAGTPEFVEPVVGDHEHVGREGLVGASGWITLDAADGQPSLRTQITKPYLQRIED